MTPFLPTAMVDSTRLAGSASHSKPRGLPLNLHPPSITTTLLYTVLTSFCLALVACTVSPAILLSSILSMLSLQFPHLGYSQRSFTFLYAVVGSASPLRPKAVDLREISPLWPDWDQPQPFYCPCMMLIVQSS
jgi:hypothetical protein